MGALDVCPFIPVQGVSVDDCIECAKEFGRRLSAELSVPVYLYGMAAEKGEYRRTLPQIRAGEYEGLSDKVRRNVHLKENKYKFTPVLIFTFIL